MVSLQIILIWGAASAALFSSPARAGEYEHYKDLRAALVRSDANRDRALPAWVGKLEYKRPDHWYWPSAKVEPIEPAKPETPPTSKEKAPDVAPN